MGNIIENGNYCVYVHTSPSGKMYVGQTGLKPEQRWGKNGIHYLKKKKNGKYVHPMFAYAILKYGWENIEHEIIASNLTKEEANNFEKLLIEKLNTKNHKYGYNLKDGGSNIGEPTEETKQKISDSNKGENNPFYGRQHSEESKNKMSESHKGQLVGVEHPNSKKVAQYDFCGIFIRFWDCINDAAKTLNINKNSIVNCCKGNQKKAGGFIWGYAYEELTEEHIKWCNETCRNENQKKSVAQYSLDNEFIRWFDSIAEAESVTGIDRGSISACCRGKNAKAGGFIWKYYDVNNVEIVA